jgi:hypothetical protein
MWCLREAPRVASGEPARVVAVAQLAHHPRGRLARHTAQSHDGAIGVLHHGLEASIAQQPLDGAATDDRTAFDDGVRIDVVERVDVCVDDDGRAILVLVGGESRRAHRREGVRPACPGVPIRLLTGHRRDLATNAVEGPGHDRTLRRRQLRVEQPLTPVVGVAPLEPPSAGVVVGLLVAAGGPEVSGTPDGSG